VVRFAVRAQQPATLNEVIEATTSEFGGGADMPHRQAEVAF
jgi:hypothetical protein